MSQPDANMDPENVITEILVTNYTHKHTDTSHRPPIVRGSQSTKLILNRNLPELLLLARLSTISLPLTKMVMFSPGKKVTTDMCNTWLRASWS